MEKKKFMGLYTSTYLALGTLVPLIGAYLSEIGFSGTQIGIITAVGTFSAIVANFFWGKVYSNLANGKKLLIFLCFFACLLGLFLTQMTSFFSFLFVFAMLYFFQAPIMSLSDALTLENQNFFGQIRLWGAVGFAGGVFVTGYLASFWGMKIIFPMYATAFFLAAVILVFLKTKKKDSSSWDKRKNWRYRDLLPYRSYWKLILCAFFVGGTNVANNTYFSFLYMDGGGTIAGVGLAFLLMAGSEAPMMAWTKKLDEIFSLEKLILWAMIFSMFRFLWYGTGPSSPWLLGTFFLQGVVNGILLVELIRYIAKMIPPELMGMALGVYYAFSSGCSTIFCQWLGGRLLDAYGSSGVYVFFALFNGVGVVLYLVFRLFLSFPDKEKAHPLSLNQS